MSTIYNVRLIDDIKHDTQKLMRENPNLSYPTAYDMARKNLIGDLKITEFKYQNLSVDINLTKKEVTQNESIGRTKADEVMEAISKIINVGAYTPGQIKQYIIAYQMGVDIAMFAHPEYSEEQIKFLSVMATSGKDITPYLGVYDFDPSVAFMEMAEKEINENSEAESKNNQVNKTMQYSAYSTARYTDDAA